MELLGTSAESIELAEDRELFKELCQQPGRAGAARPRLPTRIEEAASRPPRRIGYPVVLRPAFTLGGTGGGFADDETELRETDEERAGRSRPSTRCWLRRASRGYKEIEYEVMRDANDTAITVCNMENIDPVGIHTGDSHRRGPQPDADQQASTTCCATAR